jgi:hypothetical protein
MKSLFLALLALAPFAAQAGGPLELDKLATTKSFFCTGKDASGTTYKVLWGMNDEGGNLLADDGNETYDTGGWPDWRPTADANANRAEFKNFGGINNFEHGARSTDDLLLVKNPDGTFYVKADYEGFTGDDLIENVKFELQSAVCNVR